MELREFRLRRNNLLGENNLLRDDLTPEEWTKVEKIHLLHNKMNAPRWWIHGKWEAFMWTWFKSGGSYWKNFRYKITH